MPPFRTFLLPLLLSGAVFASGCTHTPAGTSVLVALARRPEVITYPAPPPSAQPKNTVATGGTAPIAPEKTELVADAFSRAEFCLTTGKDDEAIAAFREVVKIDPKFGDAWTKLAVLYEKTGQEQLAVDAFRKAKTLGGQRSVQ